MYMSSAIVCCEVDMESFRASRMADAIYQIPAESATSHDTYIL